MTSGRIVALTVSVGALAPTAIVESDQLQTRSPATLTGSHVHPVPLVETLVQSTSAGRVSVTTIGTAATEGPLLVTSTSHAMDSPAVNGPPVEVLVSWRSALVPMALIVPSVLLAGTGSVVGCVTVAVLLTFPSVSGKIVALIESVGADPFTDRVAADQWQTRTPATVTASQVQSVPLVATLVQSTDAGSVSVTVNGATATEGPWLTRSTSHSMVSPAVKGAPTEVLMSSTSALIRTVSLVSSVLLGRSGSGVVCVTVAVLSTVPTTFGSTVPLTVSASVEPPTRSVAVDQWHTRSPEPVMGSQVHPVPLATTLSQSMLLGSSSVTVKGATATDGPWFVAVRAQVIVWPAVKGPPADVLTSSTSATITVDSGSLSWLLEVTGSKVFAETVASFVKSVASTTSAGMVTLTVMMGSAPFAATVPPCVNVTWPGSAVVSAVHPVPVKPTQVASAGSVSTTTIGPTAGSDVALLVTVRVHEKLEPAVGVRAGLWALSIRRSDLSM